MQSSFGHLAVKDQLFCKETNSGRNEQAMLLMRNDKDLTINIK